MSEPGKIPEMQYAVSMEEAAVVLAFTADAVKQNPVPTLIAAAALGYIAALAGPEWYNRERPKAIAFLQEYAQSLAKLGGEIAKKHLGEEFQKRMAAEEVKKLDTVQTFFGKRPRVPEV